MNDNLMPPLAQRNMEDATRIENGEDFLVKGFWSVLEGKWEADLREKCHSISLLEHNDLFDLLREFAAQRRFKVSADSKKKVRCYCYNE